MIGVTKEDDLIISRIADGALQLWEAGTTMSPILIAILAVFCCLIGFVMGRYRIDPITHPELMRK